MGDPQRHYGMKKDVQFQARPGSCRSVNFEVSDATGAMWPVLNCADSAAMTTFKLHGGGKIIKVCQSNPKN